VAYQVSNALDGHPAVAEDGHERLPQLPWRPVLTDLGRPGDGPERAADVPG
jgi:hypothetical protein